MTEEAQTTSPVCYRHPDRETMLRCNRCNRPICTACVVPTPTGYRCPECVRGQQKIFETARWSDFPLAFIVAALLSLAGSYFASLLSFFTIFVAPIAGVITAEAIRKVIGRRRSKRLFQVATAGVIIGALPMILLRLIPVLYGNAFALFPLLWPGIYLFLVASTTYYRLSGIQIR